MALDELSAMDRILVELDMTEGITPERILRSAMEVF
jgi:hypothetical protein